MEGLDKETNFCMIATIVMFGRICVKQAAASRERSINSSALMGRILYSLLTRQETRIADASLRTTQKCHQGEARQALLLLPLQINPPFYLSTW
jgi:hypothetical protein